MIKRNALIIECSAIDGQEKLPGATRDASAWQNYLLSNRGGAWRSNEISILSNPTLQIVRSKIALMTDGYSFVTFSGHGYVSARTKETMLCLQGGEISEIGLTPSSNRVTLILDSCRGIISEALAFAEARALLRKSEVDSSQFRNLFDSALERAEMGACKLYGCAFDQSAQETKAGGVFTQSMIQAGINWTGSGVFSLRNAFDEAEKMVARKHPQQTPEPQLGRRLNHFPFAVQPT